MNGVRWKAIANNPLYVHVHVQIWHSETIKLFDVEL